MKRLLLMAAATVLVFNLGGRAEAAEAGDVVFHNATADITHLAGTEPVDQVDLMANFTNKESESCESGDSPLNHGVMVTLQQGLCGSAAPAVNLSVPSFRPLVKRSNVAKFEGKTLEGVTVDAVLTTLGTVPGTCGSWKLKVDAVNVDLWSINANPVAMTITLADGSSGCLSINHAQIQ